MEKRLEKEPQFFSMAQINLDDALEILDINSDQLKKPVPLDLGAGSAIYPALCCN